MKGFLMILSILCAGGFGVTLLFGAPFGTATLFGVGWLLFGVLSAMKGE